MIDINKIRSDFPILKEKVRSEAVEARLVIRDDQDITKLC